MEVTLIQINTGQFISFKLPFFLIFNFFLIFIFALYIFLDTIATAIID